jgi:hypothetical protein
MEEKVTVPDERTPTSSKVVSFYEKSYAPASTSPDLESFSKMSNEDKAQLIAARAKELDDLKEKE